MLHDLFNASHYLRQVGCDLDDAAALDHFQRLGDMQGLDPSAYFSTLAYKARYPDWNANGSATAVADFLARTRRGQTRQPHPLIDPDHYRLTYPDLAGLGANAALHFIRHGDAEGRSPSEGFDAAFYRRCYLPLGQGHAFRHYITKGAALGHLPRPESRSATASLDAMRQATAGLARPLVLVSHDAQAAGVPILTVDLARAIRGRGWDPVFLLGNAGPLAARFGALGPVFVLAEGWDTAGLAQGLPPDAPVLINTSAAAALAPTLAGGGRHCLVLIHEMADYIRDQGFLPDLRAARSAGAGLIVSMPRMMQTLGQDPGGVEWIQPGITLTPTPFAAFRKALGWQRARPGPVFIGAGHADRRKGFDLFIGAAQRIAAADPTARFVWLGALDEWARGIADTALAGGLSLTLPGFVHDSLAWYRAADVYLLTSRQDPGPTTAIHAAAMGTPFVGYAADIGLVGLTDGIGRFVPQDNEAGFVAAAREAAATGSIPGRRALRHLIRTKADFGTYVDALLARLTACQASG